jgi:hypothetical protein
MNENIDKSNYRAQSIPLIRQVITEWQKPKYFTYEEKLPHFGRSPISEGEHILRFSAKINSFFCQKELIPIELTSGIFHTTTLSSNPLSDNVNADAIRLKKFLEDFDEVFYLHVEQKINECEETVMTSDPIWMKL